MKMLLQITCSALLVFHFVGCAEGDCENMPHNRNKIELVLYYDAGVDIHNKNPVGLLLNQLCENIAFFDDKFTTVLKPGAAILWDDGAKNMICSNNLNQDCTFPRLHACAHLSGIKPEFFIFFACCAREQTDVEKIKSCAVEMGAKKDHLETCLIDNPKTQDPPETLLWNNTQELHRIISPVTVDVFPAPVFNGVYTKCLAEKSRTHLINLVCKMLMQCS